MQALETERLVLREFRKTDLADFYEYCKSPNVGPRAGWKPHESKDESKAVLKKLIRSGEVWAIVLKGPARVIGSIGLHKDEKRPGVNARMLGYALAEEQWGRGLMTEAAMAVIIHAFSSLKLEVLSVYHYPFNRQSKRVIEKCGFFYEGTMRCAGCLYDGSITDEASYSIIHEDFDDLMLRKSGQA